MFRNGEQGFLFASWEPVVVADPVRLTGPDLDVSPKLDMAAMFPSALHGATCNPFFGNAVKKAGSALER
jgi:hypothetical protein